MTISPYQVPNYNVLDIHPGIMPIELEDNKQLEPQTVHALKSAKIRPTTEKNHHGNTMTLPNLLKNKQKFLDFSSTELYRSRNFCCT